MSKKNKYKIWQDKRKRTKYHIMRKNVANLPRLVVFRSNLNIYAQLIDDDQGTTVASASSLENELKDQNTGSGKISISRIVGESLGKKAVGKGISEIVFDRGGYKYHGRVKAVADGAREAGLKF